jgi:predicted  nucleic acid-binding Zn-ribbon protein
MKDLLTSLVQLQSLEFGDDHGPKVESAKAELRAKIPSQIIAHYDRLVAHGKKGMAAVRGQVCSGCHMQVPLGVVMSLRHEQDIQLCGSCGRYLYLPPEGETKAAEPAVAPKPARKTRKSKKSVQVI